MRRRRELEQQIHGVAALEDPVRRSLYLYVAAQAREVGRAEAARAVGVSRALAAFHLDKLVEEGLLEVGYRRLSGRQGPGAGRPAKVYRRSGRQLELTLPERRYELAARLLAQALTADSEADPRALVDRGARRLGMQLGEEGRRRAGPRASEVRLLARAEEVLRAHGYEPFRSENGEIRLRNCPFHALARQYAPLVCSMNLALLEGLVAGLGLEGVDVLLDPRPDLCCVALRPGRPRKGQAAR